MAVRRIFTKQQDAQHQVQCRAVLSYGCSRCRIVREVVYHVPPSCKERNRVCNTIFGSECQVLECDLCRQGAWFMWCYFQTVQGELVDVHVHIGQGWVWLCVPVMRSFRFGYGGVMGFHQIFFCGVMGSSVLLCELVSKQFNVDAQVLLFIQDVGECGAGVVMLMFMGLEQVQASVSTNVGVGIDGEL